MKTAGIVTIYDLNNYGNRLQNYAVQKILTGIGLSVKTFSMNQYLYGYNWKYSVKKRIHEMTNYRLTSSRESWSISNQQYAFEQFTKRYLPTEKVIDVESLGEKADYFVLGSDQVWNASWYGKKDWEMYLLTFAKPEQKVCFSPSFGIEELKEEWKPWFAQYLPTFPILSVREDAGARIIKELTGQDAQVMIDPTMMLDEKDWQKVAKKPHGVNTRKPFILTYFLGNRTEQVGRDILELQKKKNYVVYHLLDQSQFEVYACGPREFLYLFSKADIVLTDSFHACVFSFLFNKPFLVYDRVEEGVCQMNSRLETLLGMLKLERKYRNKGLPNDWLEHDYGEGRKILEIKRATAREFLDAAFKE